MAQGLPHDASATHSIVIRPDDTSLSLAQAIYHHVTTKTERILEVFREYYIVRENDIVQLSHVLKQVAQRHHEEEWSCVIDHAIFKRSRSRFSSLERFKLADKGQSDPTGEIVIVYDFLSKNPFSPESAKLTAERYKIEVRINQEPYLSTLDDDDTRPTFISRLVGFPSLTASIEYVDYTVARAILSAIREWVDSLETCKRSKSAKFIMRNELSLHGITPSVFGACILLGAAGLVRHVASVSWPFVFLTLAIAALFSGLGALIADSIITNIYKLQTPTIILITRGDTENQVSLAKRQSRARRFLALIAGTIFLAIVVNVFSSFIYQWITK